MTHRGPDHLNHGSVRFIIKGYVLLEIIVDGDGNVYKTKVNELIYSFVTSYGDSNWVELSRSQVFRNSMVKELVS